jgi:hypothetical protein
MSSGISCEIISLITSNFDSMAHSLPYIILFHMINKIRLHWNEHEVYKLACRRKKVNLGHEIFKDGLLLFATLSDKNTKLCVFHKRVF